MIIINGARKLMMDQRSVRKIAESLGLSIEMVFIENHENALRVYKGAKQIFVGTEEAVRDFLGKYQKERPGPYAGSMHNYIE